MKPRPLLWSMTRFFFSDSSNELETREKLLSKDWSPGECLCRIGKANKNELELLEKMSTQKKGGTLQTGVDKKEHS